MFGPRVKEPINDVTPTLINTRILAVLRECNDVADNVLRESGEMNKLSQMPLVMLPVHFDRDPQQHVPSCQHSVAIRTFITNDFMTGHAAQPGLHISEQVCFIVQSLHVFTYCLAAAKKFILVDIFADCYQDGD